MFNTSRPNSLPKPANCYNLNILHEHFQRNDVEIMLGNGVTEKTTHIVADGRQFNFYDAYGTQEDWNFILIRELSYLDASGDVQTVQVNQRNPHPIESMGDTHCGYVTKINDKRWGVNITLNLGSGKTSIITDDGSPIIGCLFQLIE